MNLTKTAGQVIFAIGAQNTYSLGRNHARQTSWLFYAQFSGRAWANTKSFQENNPLFLCSYERPACSSEQVNRKL